MLCILTRREILSLCLSLAAVTSISSAKYAGTLTENNIHDSDRTPQQSLNLSQKGAPKWFRDNNIVAITSSAVQASPDLNQPEQKKKFVRKPNLRSLPSLPSSINERENEVYVQDDVRQLFLFCPLLFDLYVRSVFTDYGASDELYESFKKDFCTCSSDSGCTGISDTDCLSDCAYETAQSNLVILLIVSGQSQCNQDCNVIFTDENRNWSCDSACSCVELECSGVPSSEYVACVTDCFCQASSYQVNGRVGLECPPTLPPTPPPTTPNILQQMTQTPSQSVVSTVSTKPSKSAQPSSSMVPSQSAQPSSSVAPSQSNAPSQSAQPSISMAPSQSNAPSLSAQPSISTALSQSSKPT